jgi:hypothetical protein
MHPIFVEGFRHTSNGWISDDNQYRIPLEPPLNDSSSDGMVTLKEDYNLRIKDHGSVLLGTHRQTYSLISMAYKIAKQVIDKPILQTKAEEKEKPASLSAFIFWPFLAMSAENKEAERAKLQAKLDRCGIKCHAIKWSTNQAKYENENYREKVAQIINQTKILLRKTKRTIPTSLCLFGLGCSVIILIGGNSLTTLRITLIGGYVLGAVALYQKVEKWVQAEIIKAASDLKKNILELPNAYVKGDQKI